MCVYAHMCVLAWQLIRPLFCQLPSNLYYQLQTASKDTASHMQGAEWLRYSEIQLLHLMLSTRGITGKNTPALTML